MKTATFLSKLSGWTGDARLYRLSEPLGAYKGAGEPRETEYVIVSGTFVLGKPETYIFAASPAGEVVNWTEMPGSIKGAIDHAEALREAGYEIADDPGPSDLKEPIAFVYVAVTSCGCVAKIVGDDAGGIRIKAREWIDNGWHDERMPLAEAEARIKTPCPHKTGGAR